MGKNEDKITESVFVESAAKKKQNSEAKRMNNDDGNKEGNLGGGGRMCKKMDEMGEVRWACKRMGEMESNRNIYTGI